MSLFQNYVRAYGKDMVEQIASEVRRIDDRSHERSTQ